MKHIGGLFFVTSQVMMSASRYRANGVGRYPPTLAAPAGSHCHLVGGGDAKEVAWNIDMGDDLLVDTLEAQEQAPCGWRHRLKHRFLTSRYVVQRIHAASSSSIAGLLVGTRLIS